MMGYVPRTFPQSYIQARSLSGLGDTLSPPPLVPANAPSNTQSGGLMSLFGSLLGGAFNAGGQGSQTLYSLQAQQDAEDLAAQRSRRWAAFGAVAVGIAGLAGVVYLLRR